MNTPHRKRSPPLKRGFKIKSIGTVLRSALRVQVTGWGTRENKRDGERDEKNEIPCRVPKQEHFGAGSTGWQKKRWASQALRDDNFRRLCSSLVGANGCSPEGGLGWNLCLLRELRTLGTFGSQSANAGQFRLRRGSKDHWERALWRGSLRSRENWERRNK